MQSSMTFLCSLLTKICLTNMIFCRRQYAFKKKLWYKPVGGDIKISNSQKKTLPWTILFWRNWPQTMFVGQSKYTLTGYFIIHLTTNDLLLLNNYYIISGCRYGQGTVQPSCGWSWSICVWFELNQFSVTG